MTAASQICRRAAFTSRLRDEEQHQHLKLKKVAYSLAKAVMQFWHSAEVYLSNNCQNFGLKNAKHESIIFDGNEFSVNKFGEIDKVLAMFGNHLYLTHLFNCLEFIFPLLFAFNL
jgi:hypothetical protein